MKKKLTIKDIAEKAGVSIGTVDRVLHNRGDVAAKTKAKILKIAEENDYKTNIFARNLKLSKEYTIATVLPAGNQYWELQHIGFERASIEFQDQGIKIKTYEYNPKDEDAYIKALTQAIEDEPSAVVLAPVSNKITLDFLSKLDESGTPYVFVDTQLKDSSPLSFIGQDSFLSGQLAAKLLCYGLDQKPKNLFILYQESNLHNKSITERIRGFETYINKYNDANIQIYKLVIESEDDYSSLLEKIENAGEVQIFIPNSKAYQIADFIGDKNLNYRLLGYDLTEKNADNVRSGIIDFIINPRPQLQGFLSVQTLYKHLILNQKVPEVQFMPLDIVTKENLNYYDLSNA
ncbi:substrate-binding domain-containing protein [Marinigracilibium pacificum]|uniref:LacI family transcriptional regulator n=1 Tax=Marinigracilibium pacificum TaxID=2729599 RepID=A0A848J2G6_9BACT|nr:LacI family DNA-binding transcriptional regulator [Marinigracilibium pacificum]NMM49695.1 LacI family transcriptional regulator [Marinigracilibium pacificum]